MFTFNKIYYIYERRLRKKYSFFSLVNDKPTPTQLSPLWLMCNYLAIGEWSKWGFSRRFWNPKSIHSNRIFWDNFYVKNAMWLYTPNHHLSKKVGSKFYCHEFSDQERSWKIVFSKFMAKKFETIQIKMTLTENQFLIFFSFSPKLIPFLSSLISNSFYRLANSESLPLFCNFSQNIQY